MEILVVDDDVKVRETLIDLLSFSGFETTAATNGVEALRIMKEKNFPVVISDIRMPGMNGVELLREIKKNYSDTEVISITGYSQDYTFTDMVKAGASDFIAKPFSKDELEAKINRIYKEQNLKTDIIAKNKELIAAEKFLSNIIDNSLDSIIIADSKGIISRVNKAFLKLLGHKKEDVIGKSVMELSILEEGTYESTTGEMIKLGEVFFTKSQEMISSLIEEGKVSNWESYYLRSDKKIVPVEMNIVYLFDPNGERIGSVGISRDITVRKKIERNLIENRDYLNSIIESSLDSIVVTDGNGVITKANKAFGELLNRDQNEVTDKTIMEFTVREAGRYKSISGEPLKISEKYIEKSMETIFQLFEDGKIRNKRNYYIRKDNKVIPVEESIVVLYEKNKNKRGAVAVIKDISERLQLEKKNTKLYEETKSALEELKKTQSHLLQSEKMASIGQLAAGVAHEINNPTGFIHSNLGSLNKYGNKVLDLLQKYNEVFTKLNDNGSSNITSFCEEITDLKKKLKIDFIMKDFKKVISESLEGTERIKKIVSDLKNFSRVDQDNFKLADLNEGIESTLNVIWNELKYKCTVEKDYGYLPQIHCNLGQLNQVFMNILVNASHAIEEKGTITISTRHIDNHNNTEEGYIEIKISDTGSGIPEDKLARIFEPFFTTKPVGKGTGLGMSIAYDIIKKHRGEIFVESELGKGTIFTIQLPLIKVEEKQENLDQ
jgi:PAS domain S-box-containing protein